MNIQFDVERLLLAQKALRAELVAERLPTGRWEGYPASSPLATAAAVCALVAAHRTDTTHALRDDASHHAGLLADHVVQGDLCEFLLENVHWLAQHQNADGGWGDCVGGRSNIAATMLVQAAFRFTGVPAKYDDLILRADQFIAAQGGAAALRRQFRGDKTLSAAVLATCAVAGTVPWSKVPALPFEQACVPKRWQSFVKIPAHRIRAPLLLAVGRAKFHHDPPRNPLNHLWRRSVRTKSLLLLEQMQAEDDSFFASIPTTAFVVASLASAGCRESKVVERGVEFLLASVRRDASWPVVTNFATSVTTLALRSLATPTPPSEPTWPDADIAADTLRHRTSAASSHGYSPSVPNPDDDLYTDQCLDWLLASQRATNHSPNGDSAGGWSWSDAPGAPPNAYDTAGVLITLSCWPNRGIHERHEQIAHAASRGVAWLLDLQNDDGGWPTFYRRAGGFLSDPSGPDVTATVLRALVAWRNSSSATPTVASKNPAFMLGQRIDAAVERGWRYLEATQREYGSFVPLWFGNQFQPEDQNPVIGTAEVLLMCHELSRSDWEMANRAARWLLSAQHASGGWGPPRAPVDYSGAEKDGFQAWRANESMAKSSSIEETALAVSALLPLARASQPVATAVSAGINWLTNAIEEDAHRRPAVIGFYPSKIWYHERLYPLVFARTALSRALQAVATEWPATTHVG